MVQHLLHLFLCLCRRHFSPNFKHFLQVRSGFEESVTLLVQTVFARHHCSSLDLPQWLLSHYLYNRDVLLVVVNRWQDERSENTVPHDGALLQLRKTLLPWVVVSSGHHSQVHVHSVVPLIHFFLLVQEGHLVLLLSFGNLGDRVLNAVPVRLHLLLPFSPRRFLGSLLLFKLIGDFIDGWIELGLLLLVSGQISLGLALGDVGGVVAGCIGRLHFFLE